MAKNLTLGKLGEQIAVQYLKNKGYEILEQNWRAYRKEIDIIAIDGKDIVFVEVKTRKNDDFGSPEMAVNRRKRAHIYSAANAYYQTHKIDQDVRFDVVAIVYNDGHPQINHLVDAFHSIDWSGLLCFTNGIQHLLSQSDGVALFQKHYLTVGVGDEEYGAAIDVEMQAINDFIADDTFIETINNAFW